MHDKAPQLAPSPSSPSLGRCSSVNLAEIAARVVDELRVEKLQTDGDLRNPQRNFAHDRNDSVFVDDKAADERDRGFEFEFVCREPAITADKIFCNGQILPMYPYPLDSVMKGKVDRETKPPARHRRPALRKLMSEERNSASFTSSEADEELSGVSPEAYCVWNPKRTEDRDSSSPSRSRIRIKSSGSSMRWNLRDLLYVRSSKEGKQTFKSLDSRAKIA